MTDAPISIRSWQKDEYFISTDSSLIPASKLGEIITTDDFYWAKPTPEPLIQKMLDNSLCFGLFKVEGFDKENERQTFVGLARCITDYVSFVYVDDVWTSPSIRGQGLGTWLVSCVREVIDEMPHLRQSMLHTKDWQRSVPFYKKLLQLEVTSGEEGEGLAIMEKTGPGTPDYCATEAAR